MEKAKVEMQQAKAEMLQTQKLIDALAKDGLIDKNKNYDIKAENGELFINDVKQSKEVYNKYEQYLPKGKSKIHISESKQSSTSTSTSI
jgi:hypothetical protein